MAENSRSTVSSALVNRTVAWVFGILVVFVLQAITLLELDPFANLVVRVLLLPGYVVMLGYVVIVVALMPEAGRVVWLLGAAVYLYLVSVIIAGIYRRVR